MVSSISYSSLFFEQYIIVGLVLADIQAVCRASKAGLIQLNARTIL